MLASTPVATDPAGAVVAGDHPGTKSAKVSLVPDFPRVNCHYLLSGIYKITPVFNNFLSVSLSMLKYSPKTSV